MPKDFDTNLISFTSGKYGSRKSNVSYKVQNNIIKGNTNSRLYENESLTVRIELPNGYFANAANDNKVFDYIFLIISIILLITAIRCV